MHIFFSFLKEETDISEAEGTYNSFIKSFNTVVWVFTSLVWSSYVYIQELEKKTQFVNGHKRVRQFLKLKSILNILVPSLVRDKIRAGKKNYQEEEGEVTIIYLDILDFDYVVSQFRGKKNDLLVFMDGIYNTID